VSNDESSQVGAADSESLTKVAARGGVYVLIRRLSANLLRIGAVAILARNLSKSEFGVVALAQMAVSLLTVFGSGGIATYLVCDREPDWETRIQPAFWLNLTLTTASCVIAIACLPLIQLIYDQPQLTGVLLVILADYFIDQLKSVPDGLVQRRLGFRILAIRDTSRDFLADGIAIAMALDGFGVWSLVVPNVAIVPLEVLFTMWAAKFRPRLALGRASWPRIFRFTRNVMGEQLLSFIGNEADTAVVGKVMGSEILGVYNLAYQLANLIGKNVTAVLSMVSTPALAKAFERQTGLGAPYRRMLRALSLISTPLLLGMFVLAPELVQIVYGAHWADVVPLLRLFIVFTLVRSVTSPSGVIFNVAGRPDLSMRIVFWFLVLYIPALLVTARYGVLALALCVTVARVIIGLVSLYMSLDLIEESKWRVTEELLRPLAAGLVMAVGAWLVGRGMVQLGWPGSIRIVVVTIVGTVIYLGMIRIMARRALDEALGLVKALLQRRRQAPTIGGA
jgi:PST family polysaccharide transporter